MATAFLDLPEELILHVAELLDICDRRNMRLVAKRINHLISPIMFETLRSLEPTLYGPEPYAVLSEHLSREKELVFSRCTKKIIISINATDCPLDRELPWLKLLNNLTPTLTNLRSLEWSYWPENYPVSHLVIDAFNSFGSLPNLQDLTVVVVIFDPFPGFNLKRFSNLSSLEIIWEHTVNLNGDFVDDIADLLGRCPNLDRLTFCIPRPYHPPEAPLLAHIFAGLPFDTPLNLKQLDVTGLHVSADDFRAHVHHLLSLKVLRLMFNRHPDAPQQNGQICQLLLNNSIHLDEFAIDTTHPTGVLDYLSSYSGLTHLEFQSRYPGADTPEGVHRFFSSVLPTHDATLQVLELGWSVDTLWSRDIAPEDLAQVEKCQHLIRLYCCVNMTMGSPALVDRLLLTWLETGLKLPRLQYLFFRLVCRSQPPLDMGEFAYNYETSHWFRAEEEVRDYTLAVLERLKADRIIPFETGVLSPTLGP